jgi:hypothetical protein
MARMLTVGKSIVFGCVEPKPIAGFPAGRAKIKIRNTSAVRAYIKTATGIRQFAVHDNGTHWEPAFEIGRNKAQTEAE